MIEFNENILYYFNLRWYLEPSFLVGYPNFFKMASFPPTPSTASPFLNSLAKKLDDTNYLFWRQQIEPIIKAHKLQWFVVNPVIPPQYLSETDCQDGKVNPAFEAWEVHDQMLLTWLQSTLSKSVLSRVIGSTHSYQVWDKIHEYFHLQTKAHTRQLRTDLRTTSLDGKTMREFLSQIKTIADEIAGVGNPIPLEEHVDAILEGLSQDYASVISVMESKFTTPPVAEVEALLLAHESRLARFTKQSFSPSVNYTQGYPHPTSSDIGTRSHSAVGFVRDGGGRGPNGARGGSNKGRRGGGPGRGRGGRFANFQCQICLKYGHTANICFYRADSSYQPHESLVLHDPSTQYPVQPTLPQSIDKASNTWVNPNLPNSTPANALLTSSQNVTNSTWIPDSGASFHVTGESQNIHQLGHFNGPDQIFIGNGQGLPITGSSVSSFLSPLNSIVALKLNNLLHVPSLTKNLLSVSKFAQDNCVFFEFHSDHCLVKSQGTNEVLLQGVVGFDGLYCFPNLKLHPPSALLSSFAAPPSTSAELLFSFPSAFKTNDVNNAVMTPSLPSLWHSRLGHPHSHVLNLVLRQCNVSSSNKNVPEFCSSCCVGKSHRLPSSVSTTVYTMPLELIFTDLWGPSHIPSHFGYLYYVSFIDAYSRFTWIYPLKSKAETLATFQQFKAMVELQLNSKIKSVQSD